MVSNKIDLKLANIILDALRAKGYTCGIVGGYARDTFFGLTPKDADICVAAGDADNDAVLSAVSSILFEATYSITYPQ